MGIKDSNQGISWAFHSLGNLYADQDKMNEAKAMYQRALLGYENDLGDKVARHRPALNTLRNLADLRSLGRRVAARQLYKKAYNGLEQLLDQKNATVQSLKEIPGVLASRDIG
ncbi:IMP-specific 5'-nucleotidase 1 [Apiospora arundinis]